MGIMFVYLPMVRLVPVKRTPWYEVVDSVIIHSCITLSHALYVLSRVDLLLNPSRAKGSTTWLLKNCLIYPLKEKVI